MQLPKEKKFQSEYSARNVALYLIDRWQAGLSPETLKSLAAGSLDRGARNAGAEQGSIARSFAVKAVPQAARRHAAKPVKQARGVTYPHAAAVCRILSNSGEPDGPAAAAAIATAFPGHDADGRAVVARPATRDAR